MLDPSRLSLEMGRPGRVAECDVEVTSPSHVEDNRDTRFSTINLSARL